MPKILVLSLFSFLFAPMKVLKIVLAGLVLSQTALAIPVLADWSSPDGSMTVQWAQNISSQYDENCSVTQPVGQYQVSNGVSGLLYYDACGEDARTPENSRSFTFVDTAGSDLCIGTMLMSYERGALPGEPIDEAMTNWAVKVPVAGQRCGSMSNNYLIPITSRN